MSTKDNKNLPGIMGLFAKTKTPAQALVEVGALATKLKRKPPVLLLEDDKTKTKKQSPRLLKFSAIASRLSRASKLPSERPRASQAQEKWTAMPRDRRVGEFCDQARPRKPQVPFSLH